jgi:hypothetical protein
MIAQFVPFTDYALEQCPILAVLEHSTQNEENSLFIVLFEDTQHLTMVTVIGCVIYGDDRRGSQ